MSYLIQNEVIKDLEIAEGFKLIDLDDVKKNMYYISEDGKIYSTFLNDFLIQREEIYNLLKNGNQPKEIIKIGYPSSVVWRCKKKLEIVKEAMVGLEVLVNNKG